MNKTLIWVLVIGGGLVAVAYVIKSREQTQPNYTSAIVTLGKIFA